MRRFRRYRSGFLLHGNLVMSVGRRFQSISKREEMYIHVYTFIHVYIYKMQLARVAGKIWLATSFKLTTVFFRVAKNPFQRALQHQRRSAHVCTCCVSAINGARHSSRINDAGESLNAIYCNLDHTWMERVVHLIARKKRDVRNMVSPSSSSSSLLLSQWCVNISRNRDS